MPRNAYRTLQCAYEDFREICWILSDNELTPYKLLTKPTNIKFIRITYTYECGFVKTSCFRTTQSANLNKNATVGTH
ncbi:hypothetical protein Hanom_Chr09g00790691 [Helianthus anomalus]